jgi:formate hydrogenlyase transcriptional activator
MSLNGFTVVDVYRQDSQFTSDLLSTVNIHPLDEPLREETKFEAIVGQSSTLRQVLQLVETVATGDSTVLLLGETGTGKELIARAIHNHSRRKDRTFVKLNCAAIPSGLLESELFGHERGAFTGAITEKIGRLELADQGSLFLDEIGDIPLELQPKLLRALQEREFERLGSTRTKKVDVRVVAATHHDLEEMILKKQFRSDLYYRLNVFPIPIPPLRERPDDVLLLVQHFVQQAARRMNKTIDTISSEAMEALTQYQWPGNIRELENVIERAVILSPGSILHVPLRDLHSRITPGHDGERLHTLADVEREHIRAILKETRWVLSGPRGAATRLGLNRSTLYFRMKKLGIARPWS